MERLCQAAPGQTRTLEMRCWLNKEGSGIKSWDSMRNGSQQISLSGKAREGVRCVGDMTWPSLELTTYSRFSPKSTFSTSIVKVKPTKIQVFILAKVDTPTVSDVKL